MDDKGPAADIPESARADECGGGRGRPQERTRPAPTGGVLKHLAAASVLCLTAAAPARSETILAIAVLAAASYLGIKATVGDIAGLFGK